MSVFVLVLLSQLQPLNLNQQAIVVKDEGTTQSTVRATTINCTGTGVTCTQSAQTMTLNVTGGGGGGGVSSVTASAPLASSGGATPNVSLTGTVPAANGGLGATQPTCGAGEFLTCDGSVCTCDTPGVSQFRGAVAILSLDGAGYYATTVTGYTWVTANSQIVCAPLATTLDGMTPELVSVAHLTVSVGSLVPGVGFKVHVFSPHGLAGDLRLQCVSSEVAFN